MEVDEPEVAHVHVDGPPEHVKQVKNTQFEVSSWLILRGCISSDKSAMAS